MDGYPMSMLPQEFADLNRAERMEKARRLSRYDEAIRLLREWVNEDRDWPHGKTVAFLAAEPTKKGADE